MPKASKETASHVNDVGVLESRYEELGGYTVEFTTFREDADARPFFAGLPDDRCQSPHWGYVLARQADASATPTARRSTRRATPTTLRPATSRSSPPAPRSSSSARPRSTRGPSRSSAATSRRCGRLRCRRPRRGDRHDARWTSPPRPAIEAAEARAWADLYAAAPAELGGRGRARRRACSGDALRAPLGGERPALLQPHDRARRDRAGEPSARSTGSLGLRREPGSTMFLLQSLPHCRPAAYEEWLRARGLEPFDAQDRIVRGAAPSPARHSRDDRRARGRRGRPRHRRGVGRGSSRPSTASTPAPGCTRLIGRPGWHQYFARDAGEIVAARGMWIGHDGTAWLGMDGPVPGIMTDDYVPDAAICARIVADGLARGARRFIADIEAPSPAMDTPAYANFARLGFRRPYVRTHWTTGERT